MQAQESLISQLCDENLKLADEIQRLNSRSACTILSCCIQVLVPPKLSVMHLQMALTMESGHLPLQASLGCLQQLMIMRPLGMLVFLCC